MREFINFIDCMNIEFIIYYLLGCCFIRNVEYNYIICNMYNYLCGNKNIYL